MTTETLPLPAPQPCPAHFDETVSSAAASPASSLASSPPTRQPVLWIALAYSGGLFTGSYVWRPPSWWVIASLSFALFAICLLHRRPWAGFTLALSSVFLVGVLAIQVQTGKARDPLRSLENGDAVITAHVVREGTLERKGPSEIQQRVDLEPEQILVDNETVNSHSGLRATFYSKETDDSSAPASIHIFRYGERIRFSGRLSAPHNFRNPGAFDYGGYLAEHGIVGLVSAKAQNVKLLPGFFGNRAELWRTRFHRSIIERIHQLWPEREAALVDAMLIGENSLVGRELLTEFQRTGTYHVLVISGLKVGILALVIAWTLRRTGVAEFAASAVAVLFTIAYAVLTDVGVPVWRATLMLALYLFARMLYRRRSVLNTIGLAAVVLLLIDPSALAGASFQLSFLCVLIIAAVGAPVLERTTRPLASALRNWNAVAYDFALPPKLVQWRLDLRMVAGRLQRFIGARVARLLLVDGARALVLGCEFLIISFVIQVGFALPMAYYFHRATLVSLPANVLAVPLTEIALVASILSIATSYVTLSFAKLPGWVAGISLHAMAGSVRWLGALRIADTRVPTPNPTLILACGATLVLAMVLARRRLLFATTGLVAITASAFWICTVEPRPQMQPGMLEMTALDVGEGDSILLVSPQGKTLLVDAGGIPHWMHSELDIGEDVVSPYLWSRGFKRLDAVAVTHPHADHIGGMSAILANFRPRELWIAAGPTNYEMENLLGKARELGVPVFTRSAGDRFDDLGISFRILAPSSGASVAKINDDSLVMKATYQQTSVLLEGDAEKPTENRIIGEEPTADLLKVAHHGSKTSTQPDLLAAVHPSFALISVGRGNVYGHPRMEVLQRLATAHVRTYRTDLDGAVTFYLDGTQVIPAPDR